MGSNCPHCSVEIESLSGFVSQADLETRIGAKNGEIKALGDALKVSKTKASGFDAIVMERDQLQTEIVRRDEKATRTTAMSEHGLDPGLLDHVDLLYNSATAGLDEKPTLAEWLAGDGKAHPLLADKFGKGAPDATVDPTKTGPNLNGPNGNPDTTTGATDPPPPGGKISPADLQSYFAGPEFAALSVDDRRAKIGEMEAKIATQESAGA